MAKKYRLYYRISKAGLSGEQIKKALRERGLKVARATLYKDSISGVLVFQKETDREAAHGTGPVDFDGVQLEFTGTTPPGGLPPRKKTVPVQNEIPGPSKSSQGGATPMATRFFNPYHFVDVKGFTPRYTPMPHDRFSGHCGRIEAEAEFLTPVFIPDPENRRFIISDETVVREDEGGAEATGQIHLTVSKWLEQQDRNSADLPLEIFFDLDCLHWDPDNPGDHIWAKRGPDTPGADAQSGRIIERHGRFFIETREPNRWAHKEMAFFKINGQFALPPASLKGMLRNAVEILSNSCFPGVKEEDEADYLFHRLDVQEDNHELRGLKAVVLKSMSNGRWGYVTVDHAKVLSPHLFNRIGGSGENALGAYWNRSDSYYEKLSVVGKEDHDPDNCSGLHAYEGPAPRGKNYRGEIREISSETDIETRGFAVTKIKEDILAHAENQYNKTFPFVDSVAGNRQLWAIIRQLKIPKKHGKGFFLNYKIKVIAGNKVDLKEQLKGFNAAKHKEKNANRVTYAISEIRIKAAFDIDTKTQHRAFFVFGKQNLDTAVQNAHVQGFDGNEKRVIAQFRSLLRQRKEHAKKLPRDSRGINRAVAADMPDHIYDGMLAFYHETNQYLTYTTVPQKPYRQRPVDILRKMDKLPCSSLESLCPACHMFGTVIGKENRGNRTGRRASGYKGKVTVNGATLVDPVPSDPQPVTLKALSTPKPTFYPFYVLDNREGRIGDVLPHSGLAVPDFHVLDNREGRIGDVQQNSLKTYDTEGITIGRKTYLHHDPDRLNYTSDRKTNLNPTVHPLPAGTRFCFTIDFENLSNYELGLLLYALDMRYNGEKVGHHVGMGKSLGLGSCTVTLKKVTGYAVTERYRCLEEDGKSDLSEEEIAWLERGYRHVQGAEDSNNFFQRLRYVNAEQGMEDARLPGDNEIHNAYFSQRYIRDFHILKSFNIHTGMKAGLPVYFAGGMEAEGFRWYREARKKPQGRLLFGPENLARDIKTHALAP